MLSVRVPPAELNISAFPPVLRDWVTKGLGMSSLVYATGHIKDPVPLIEKRRGLSPSGRFPPSFIHPVIIITGLNKLGVVHHFHHLHERTDRTLGGRGVGPDVRFFQIIENDDRSTECESTGGLNFARQKLLLALLAFSPTQWLTQLTISMSYFIKLTFTVASRTRYLLYCYHYHVKIPLREDEWI